MPDSSPLVLLVGSATTLIGFVAKAVTDWWRERTTREEARRDKFFERRADFQRQTLLNLQDAVMELIRTAGENHHQDVMAFRKGVKWGAERLSDELDERARLAQARTIM